jgi:hypothetical protein
MLIYAKNLAGDLLVLDLPSDTTHVALHRRLAEKVCPEDPSRLVILSRTPKMSDGALSDEALTDLLDEICEMTKGISFEQEQEQEKEDQPLPEEDLVPDWEDGDLLEYIVRDAEPFTVHLFEQEPLYTMDDLSQTTPYFWMRLEVRRQAKTVHEYGFLFRLQDGIFFSKNTWKFEMDDREVYVDLLGHKGYGSLWEMLDAEEAEEQDKPYLAHIRRAVGRKWIRLLRRRGQICLAERRLRVVHPSECIPGEKQMWREHSWAMRFSQRGQRRDQRL